MTAKEEHTLQVFTIGHSNHSWDRFVELLRNNQVAVIAEVRSYPYSNYSPQFDRETMKDALAKVGVKYVDLGTELGGRPEGAEFYDADGHALYDRMAATAKFAEGIQRIEEGSQRYRIALLCSEEDPAVCHRSLLVGRVLRERGVAVKHLRADGRVQADDEVHQKSSQNDKQGTLFELAKEPAWKSIPSVLRKKPRSGSSPF